MDNKATKGTPSYTLGTIVGGNNYMFTGLPTFRSGFEACEYVKTHPMNGVVTVFEERDTIKYGVVYGKHVEVVATVSY